MNKSDRFIIDCYGIVDTWRSNGTCDAKLSWAELCDTLNRLDYLVNDQLDEYKHITELEYENQVLKQRLASASDLLVKFYDSLDDMKMIIDDGEKNEG